VGLSNEQVQKEGKLNSERTIMEKFGPGLRALFLYRDIGGNTSEKKSGREAKYI